MSNLSDPSAQKPCLIGGLGNILMADDGIGVHVVRALAFHYTPPEGVEIADLGTPGMSLLHTIACRQKIILIDCADFGGNPGEWRWFEPDDITSVKKLSGFSLHEGDLTHILGLARDMGEAPQQTLIFGIQPHLITPSEHLSAVLDAKLSEYTASIVEHM